MNIWNQAIIDSKKRARMATQLGIKNCLIYDVKKGSNEDIDAHQTCHSAKSDLKDDWRIIKGASVTNFEDTEDIVYRSNIILKDNGTVILQRLGGIFSHRNASVMRAEEQVGFQLYEKVLESAIIHKTKRKQSGYHFGIWTEVGHQSPIVSLDTRQEGNPDGLKATMDFCIWVRHYINRFVSPLLHQRYETAQEILEEYTKRKDCFEWLLNQEHGDLARLICDPMYSTFSPFNAYTKVAHLDGSDADYSVLINFGAKCYLDLPQYKLKVDLQPFDVVFFKSNTIKHGTSPNAGEKNQDARWALSCYLRKTFVKEFKKHPVMATDELVEQAMLSKKELGL